MSQDNKKNSEEEENGYTSSFRYVEDLCSGKIDGYSDDGFAKLQVSMLYCYTLFLNRNLITQGDITYYETRKKNALQINFFGWLWQYIKNWLHNKFNEVQLDLSETEVIKRRQFPWLLFLTCFLCECCLEAKF